MYSSPLSVLIGYVHDLYTRDRERKRFAFLFFEGKGMGDDVFQANNVPSSRTPRGHQGPAGFLMMVSGIDKVRNG